MSRVGQRDGDGLLDMNIFIAGSGRVGFHLARLLSRENHDVTVIESEPAQLETVDYALDVSTVLGNAASIMTLKSLNVGESDLFVATTGSDEVNLIATAAAKALGAKQVVARVNEALYVESSILYESTLNIDFVLSPEALTALDIAGFIQTPGLVASEDFGRGLVRMRQVRVTETPTVDGKTLKDVCPPGSGVLLGVIFRGDSILIPHGDTVVENGDMVTLIGHSKQIAAVERLFRVTEDRLRNVAIMGGTSIGVHLAQAIEGRQRSVKLFDRDMNRCRELAGILHRTSVVCRDMTSRADLEEEGLSGVDVFVAATRDDERNIVASMLAREIGAAQTIPVVHQPDFVPLVWKLGIDHAVTPRASFSNRILKLVHQGKGTSVIVLEEGRVEVVEITVGPRSALAGKCLRDARGRFPRQALVATIQRGDDVIVPGGDDEVRAGDSVVVVTTAESVEAVRKLFRG